MDEPRTTNPHFIYTMTQTPTVTTCATCGCLVAEEHQSLHDEWHESDGRVAILDLDATD